jgi:hypothetical protein
MFYPPAALAYFPVYSNGLKDIAGHHPGLVVTSP